MKTEPVSAEVAERFRQIQPLAERISQQCQQEVQRIGFAEGAVQLKSPEEAEYTLEADSASGEYSLLGSWKNPQGIKQGNLVFHADGTFFVEQDIVQNHPLKKRWFVEAINAWGKDDDIKVEARLLPMPG